MSTVTTKDFDYTRTYEACAYEVQLCFVIFGQKIWNGPIFVFGINNYMLLLYWGNLVLIS